MKKIISGVLACAALLGISSNAFATTSNKQTYNPTAKVYEVPLNVKLPEANIDLAILTYGSTILDVALGEINFGGNVYSKPLTIENYSEYPITVYENSIAKGQGGANILTDPDYDVNKDLKKNVKFFLSASTVSANDTKRGDGVFHEEKGDIMIPTKATKDYKVLIPTIRAATDPSNPGLGYFKINGDAAALPNPYWDEKDGAVINLILKITPTKQG